MSKMTLSEVAQKYATVQPHQIDYVLEGAPFLSKIPFIPTSRGMSHAFEKLSKVDEAAFVQVDQPLTEAGVEVELDYKTLNILGFRIKAGVDKLKILEKDFAEYLAARAPKIMTKSGMATEKELARLYKSYARNNEKVIDAGGSGSNTSTIFAVRLVEEENCGLYDKSGFGKGAFFDTVMLSNGQPYEDKDGKTVHGADFKSYINFMIENPDTVSCIVNITPDHPVTAEMLDELILNVRGGDIGKTYIVCHPKAFKYIKAVKNSKSRVVDDKVSDWDGHEIVKSYNFPEKEEALVISGATNFDINLAGDLKVFGQNFFENQAVADDGAITSEALNIGKGGHNSSILIKGIVSEDLTISSGATVKVQHSKTKNGEYTDCFTTEIKSGTHKKGSLFLEYIPGPSFLGWCKVVITTPAGATGSVDVYPMYIPR